MKEWHFEEKVYRRWVILVVGTKEELLALLEGIGYVYINEVKDMQAAGMNVRLDVDNNGNGCSHTIIWMPKFSTTVLAHELVHLVMATFNRGGVPIGIDNEEAFAFYYEYWFTEINRVRRRFPNGRNASEAKK